MWAAPTSTRSRVAVILAALAGVPALVYGVAALTLSGQVPPGTSVGGVHLGGLSPAGARARLEKAFEQRASRPLAIRADDTTITMTPAELGLAFDARATVALAMDGATTPAGVARSLFGTRALAPHVAVDGTRMAGRLSGLARRVDTKPRQGSVLYRGTEPQTVVPRPGRALDRAGAARAIRAAYLSGSEPIVVPLRPVAPAVSADQVRRTAATVARTAVAAPLTLTAGPKRAVLSRSRLAAHLRWLPDGKGGLRPVFDSADLAADLQNQLIAAGRRPKDASFAIVKGRPQVIAGRPGAGIDPGALGEAVSAALAGGSRTAEVPVTRTQPRLTTQAAGTLGVRERVGSFTTRHPCCAPRVTNIHRIADIVDGHLVEPGETFSLNGVVGRRDRARGFVEAPMILNGRFVDDVGGGVSQFATTMFNAVFFGGFEDVQHTPHQFYISRYPAGRESTVSYPEPDFRWRNDSPYGVLITTSYTGTSITVEFWSAKRFDIDAESSPRYNVKSFPTTTDSGPDCIPMTGVEGFAIDVWRTFEKDGKVVRKQRFHTVYDPEPRLTCT